MTASQPLFTPARSCPPFSKDGKSCYDIAIFAPLNSVSVSTFIKTFTAHLTTTHNLEHTTSVYYLHNEEELVAGLANNSFDLVISLDHECTTRAKKLVREQKSTLPLIFSSIEDAPAQGDDTQARITGVTAPLSDFASQMALVLSYTPSVKNILVLNDVQDPCMNLVAHNMTTLLAHHSYTVTARPCTPTITSEDILLLDSQDMLIMLNQHASQEYIHRLSLLCKEHRTALYIADTTSVLYGASFGFGTDNTFMGRQVANMAHQLITTDGVPDILNAPYHLRINMQAIKNQGLALIKIAPLLSLINTTQVVTPRTQEKVSAYLRLEQIPLE